MVILGMNPCLAFLRPSCRPAAYKYSDHLSQITHVLHIALLFRLPPPRQYFTRRHLFQHTPLIYSMTDSPYFESVKLNFGLYHAKSRCRPPRIAMQWRVGPVYSLGARDIADCNQFSCNPGLNIQSQLLNTISSWDQNAFIFINQLTSDEHLKLIQVKRIIASMTQHS